MDEAQLERKIGLFLSKIKPESKTGCWLWTGHVAKNGYGSYCDFDNKSMSAHKFSYQFFKEKVPHGLQLDHLCRVRSCVNPNHLEAVTTRENLLRGNTFAARNAAKTHCPKGHEYNDVNSYVYKSRYCKICLTARTKARRAKKRLESLEKS